MITKFLTVALLCSVCVTSQTMHKVTVAKCGGTGELLEVRVSDCTSLPCQLKRGSPTTVELDFTASTAATQVTTGAWGRFGFVKMPFVGVNGVSACDKLSAKETGRQTGCELAPSKLYSYSNSFEVPAISPAMDVLVEWALLDNVTRNKVVCFLIKAKIV